MSGLKVKNLLIKLQEKAIKKEFVDLSVIPPLKGDEVKKRIENFNSKKIINYTHNIISTNKSWK